MDGGQQAVCGRRAVNYRRHGDVGQARRRGLDIHDQVRWVGAADFGQRDLVADLADVVLLGVVSLGIGGRMEAPAHRRLIGWLMLAGTASVVVKMLDPDEAQPLYGQKPSRSFNKAASRP